MRQPQGLGLRLQACRISLGLTLSELGQHAKLDRMTIWRLEQGQIQSLQGQAIARLALSLGVNADYLLGLTDLPTPYPRRVAAVPTTAAPVSPPPGASDPTTLDPSTMGEGDPMPQHPAAAMHPQPPPPPSPRELAAEVLRLRIAALDIPSIAQALQLAPATVQAHLATSIGKSNGLFHRLRAPTLSPTLHHRVPPPGARAPARPPGRPPAQLAAQSRKAQAAQTGSNVWDGCGWGKATPALKRIFSPNPKG